MCSSPICLEKHLVFYHIFYIFFYNFFWIFEFWNEIYRNLPKFHFPVTTENEKNTEISPKFHRNFKPCQEVPNNHPNPVGRYRTSPGSTWTLDVTQDRHYYGQPTRTSSANISHLERWWLLKFPAFTQMWTWACKKRYRSSCNDSKNILICIFQIILWFSKRFTSSQLWILKLNSSLQPDPCGVSEKTL